VLVKQRGVVFAAANNVVDALERSVGYMYLSD
jgi:hypothetical protein